MVDLTVSSGDSSIPGRRITGSNDLISYKGDFLVKYLFRFIITLVAIIGAAALSWSEPFNIDRIEKISTGLGANDLGDIAWNGTSLWITGSGTLTNLVGEGYHVTDWISYDSMPGFGKATISSFFASGDTLITAWIYSDNRSGDVYPTGDGYSISTDHGQTWKHIPVTDLFPDRAGYKYPGTYTMTYDFALSGRTLWCATTWGYLLKTTDLGNTWTQVLPDTTGFDYLNVNHHGYCVEAYGDTLWVGTFMGINSSFDGGKTWKNYSWPADDSGNPQDQWPGNWVYTVEHKVVDGKTHIWAGCDKEMMNTGLGVYGICHTDDNGATWEYKSTIYNSWNFAFGHEGANDPAVSDRTVLAASDSGLVISYDLGDTWKIVDIVESASKKWAHGKQIFSVLVVGDTLWVTGSDGIARSHDWGKNWEIFQGVTRVKALDNNKIENIGISSRFDNVETYAYPNPFSPKRRDISYSLTKIHYSLVEQSDITVRIYDYQGRIIRTLVDGEGRAGGLSHDEVWDGKDSDMHVVPNGVYFYLIKTDKGDSARGKIMVLD
ncbi:T9SS type A sorting domain-containing protein [bacterium]|nr:T9SS type A sorting domain-containing protein [bacterium]